MADVFALQDEITKKVVAAIEPRLLEAEGVRSQSRSPGDLGAWDMLMQANSLFWRLTKTEGEAAIALLKKTIERYPDYAAAHSMLAFAMLVSRLFGWTLVAPPVKEAVVLARRASELDDSDPWAHLALGYVAYMMRRTDEAKQEYQRAIDLNPNFAAAYGYLGWALAAAGRTDEAIVFSEQAIRMSPQDPQNTIFNNSLAVAHYLAGRYAEATSFARRAVQQRDGMTSGHRILIACLAQAGQLEEAHAALHARNHLPSVFGAREFVDAGGLMSCSTDYPQLYYDSARLIYKIFQGAKAGDLPVQQPTKFALVINLKTTNALGLTIPPTLLARADEVIE